MHPKTISHLFGLRGYLAYFLGALVIDQSRFGLGAVTEISKLVASNSKGVFGKNFEFVTYEFYCARGYLNALGFRVNAMRPGDRLITIPDFEIEHEEFCKVYRRYITSYVSILLGIPLILF